MATMMKNERGIAMVAVLLVMLLMSALMVGFTTVIMSDQRFRGIDRDRSQAFYAAHSGLEKLTVDLNNLFFTNVAPSQGQLDALEALCPDMDAQGIGFHAAEDVAVPPTDCSGYALRVEAASSGQIGSGPYEGLIALKTMYTLDSTARTKTGGEVHLARNVETVAIPVFQFGMFSDVDLSFFAGPSFNFGGRVHTNGNLFLATGDATAFNATPAAGAAAGGLTLREKVTAVGEIVRQRLSNGESIDTQPHNRIVAMARAAGTFRALLRTEGSVVDSLGSAANPAWTNTSLSTYNGYIRNGTTGARPLNLPVITAGGSNPDLVRRPAINSNEDQPAPAGNPQVYSQRYYSQVSLRILLSDDPNDILQLPGVSPDAPVNLNTNWDAGAVTRPAWYAPTVLPDVSRPGLAKSNGNITAVMLVQTTANVFTGNPVTITVSNPAPLVAGTVIFPARFSATKTPGGATPWAFSCTGFNGVNQLTGCNVPNPAGNPVGTAIFAANRTITTPGYYLSTPGTSTVGGFIKIDRQGPAGTWTDVTQEILTWGFSAHAQSGACNPGNPGVPLADPSPNAIIRLQRVSGFSSSDVGVVAAACTGVGLLQDGVNYWPLTLFDTREGLQRDVALGFPTLGGVMHYVQIDATNLSLWFRGVAPYAAGTGPLSLPNNGFSVYFSDRRNNADALNAETGEYGFEDVVNPSAVGGGGDNILNVGEDVNGNNTLETYGQNPTYNGALGTPPGAAAPLNGAARPVTLLASAAQGQGNRAILFRRALKVVRGGLGTIVMPGLTIATENPLYVEGNWNAAAGFPAAAATSLIGDTLTLLSSNWNDDNSFTNPYTPGARIRPAQSYYRFATIAGKPPAFPRPTLWVAPTDFGTDGGAHNFLHMLESGGTVNYRGSIATFFYSRQATGTYKCCATVYGAPGRNFNFDTNFLTPALLPPLTPVFRDSNSLGFWQETRPGS